jgi:Uncharacterised nucleotidyltransferase
VSRYVTGRGSFWPTPLQEQLLVAALAGPAEAERAWRSLPRSFNIDRLEPGSFETLPLICSNLTAAGFKDTSHGRLKGIYRRSWLKNQLLLERGRATALELGGRGVRSLFLEGPAVAVRFYGELALRPTSFLHVLVDQENTTRAAAAFEAAGWRFPREVGERSSEPLYFYDAEGHGGVLRTTISADFACDGNRGAALTPIWEAASYLEGNMGGLLPSPTDLLLAICSSAARSASAPNIQWLLDAAMILRSDSLDGPRLLEMTRRSGQELRMRDALRYLLNFPRVPVPPEILSALDRTNPNRRKRIAYRLASGGAQLPGPAADLIAEHVALTAHEPAINTFCSVPDYLRRRWHLPSTSAVPAAAARRAIRMLARDRKTSA